MRKIDQQGVKDDFDAQLASLTAFHIKGLTVFSDAEQSRLTEHSLLAAAVAWEGFVSDMFIALINRDCQQFSQHLQNSFSQHLSGSIKSNAIFSAFGSLTIPGHLKKGQVESLADGLGNNISFPNFTKLEDRARQWLVAADAARFTSMTPQQKALINALISLRNHIAHRSQRSLDAMNQVTSHGALNNVGLKRQGNKFHDVGAWLKATPVGHPNNRLTIIISELQTICAGF